MNLALTVLEIVAPVFILAGVGFLWVKVGEEYRIEFVTRLAMTLSVPCLIFVALMEMELEPEALRALSLATIAVYGAITLVMAAIVEVFGLRSRTYLAPMIFGNTGNLGLPLAFFAFGDIGLSYAIIVFALMAMWSFTYGVWLVTDDGGITKVFGEPLFWATLLGGLFLWQGWSTPPVLTEALRLIGQMAIPLMLITLGVAMARLTRRGLIKPIVISSAKFIICAALSMAIAEYFALEPVAYGVLVLQAVTPVAVTSYLLAQKYGADGDAVAELVVISTLLSVAGLPLLLALLL